MKTWLGEHEWGSDEKEPTLEEFSETLQRVRDKAAETGGWAGWRNGQIIVQAAPVDIPEGAPKP